MPTTSESTLQAIFLETDGGVAAVYANKAACTGAGWDLTWQDSDGADLASQPTWTLSAGEADGRHVIGFTAPVDWWTVKITKPAGYRCDPNEFSSKGTVHDIDDIFGLIAASSGEVITETTTTGNVDLYDGNSIIIDLSVLETALSFLGVTDLASLSAMSAKIKLITDNSDDAAEVDLGTPTIITDISGTRVVRAELDAFPAALAVPDGKTTLAARCDLLLTAGSKELTAAIRDVTVRWKANP